MDGRILYRTKLLGRVREREVYIERERPEAEPSTSRPTLPFAGGRVVALD